VMKVLTNGLLADFRCNLFGWTDGQFGHSSSDSESGRDVELIYLRAIYYTIHCKSPKRPVPVKKKTRLNLFVAPRKPY
jgi:hypothetical protein